MAPTITLLVIILGITTPCIVEGASSTKVAYKKPILGKRYALLKQEKNNAQLERSFELSGITTTTTAMQNEVGPATTERLSTISMESSEDAEFENSGSKETSETDIYKNKEVVLGLEDDDDDDDDDSDVLQSDLGNSRRHSNEDRTTSATLMQKNRSALLERFNSSSTTFVKMPQRISANDTANEPIPCTCGVFLSSQFNRGTGEQPQSEPVIVNELDRIYSCNIIGMKLCQIKCLETMVQHLPNSANILCATLGRDCRKERAHLFVKNCRDQWHETNLAAGREYCCRNGKSYPCPLI